MSEQLVDRIPFAKILVGFAIAFGVALGLCGLNTVLMSSSLNTSHEEFGGGPLLNTLGWVELAVMAFCAVGIVGTGVLWVVLAAMPAFNRKDREQQRLLDDEDQTKHENQR
jgi:hypothetical protein